MDELNKLAKTVSEEAWTQLAKTACETFEKLIYPLTATTEGIGRLIEIRFNALQDEQKIIAAKCFQEVSEKIENSKNRQNAGVVIKPVIVYESLDNTDNQTDETIRSLWANLLANEFIDGNVHPEIAKLLTRITSKDALLLLEISKNDSEPLPIKVLKAMASSYTLGLLNKGKTFNHVHLENLGLIHDLEKNWYLTTAGREFLRCVSDPQ